MRRAASIDYEDELFGLDGQFYPGLDGDLWSVPPMQALAEGAMDGIDLMIGYTNYEAGVWLMALPDLDKADPAWTAARFGFLSAKTQAEAVAAYAEFFPHETNGVQGMHLVSDVGFALPTTWFAEAAAARGSKVWMYRLDYEVNATLRAMHAADLPFFFARPHSTAAAELIGPTTPQNAEIRSRLCSEMAGALISFVREGTPAWPEYNHAGGQTRIFGPESHLASHARRAQNLLGQNPSVPVYRPECREGITMYHGPLAKLDDPIRFGAEFTAPDGKVRWMMPGDTS